MMLCVHANVSVYICVSTVTQLGPDGVISFLIHLFPQLKHLMIPQIEYLMQFPPHIKGTQKHTTLERTELVHNYI